VDSASRNPVTILTALLEAGTIHVLVGTRALLGEGWDAPCINSLILASNVGSYMLTNQMRGRAIRVDKRHPDKVASIWHIVAIVIDRGVVSLPHVSTPLFWPGLADFRELDGRFSTFVGVHQSDPRIENNLLRLEIPYVRRKHDYVSGAEHLAFRSEYFRTGRRLEAANEGMVKRLHRIDDLRHQWQEAIGSADTGQVVPSVSPTTPPTAKPFHFRRTFFYFLASAIATFFIAAAVMAELSAPIGVIFAVALVWSLPKFFAAAKLFIKHLPVDGTLHQIGLAVRDTLCATSIIENSASRLKVRSYSVTGDVYVHLDGGTFHEQSVFADCMEEVLGPIENPRYLLIRYGKTLGKTRKDYHAVPTRIGVKKESAAIFHQAWLKYVGEAELLYTRTAEARKTLLYARAKAFSGGTKRAAKRSDRWV
ncbi:MAG: type III restriction endonuclease subunit R, partial [Pseudomonadota bacterium]